MRFASAVFGERALSGESVHTLILEVKMMSIFCCDSNCSCVGIAAILSGIIGVIAAFLQITAVITVTPVFLWVVFGIAVGYLAITLAVAPAIQQYGGCRRICATVAGLLTGVLLTVLAAVVLLAITFAATSVIGAIVVGILIFAIALTLGSTACLVKCLLECNN